MNLPDLLLGGDFFLDHALGVDLPDIPELPDLPVHDGLGGGRLVRFAVAVPAVAHHVDNHVLLEFHAVIQGQFCDVHDSVGVIAVHVEDRRLHHLGDVRAIQGRTRIQRVAGGKTDLVIDDDMDGAAGAVTAGLGQVEGLHHHALPGKGGVAMDDYGQNLGAGLIKAAVLARPYGPFHYRVDYFKVGGIERQGQMYDAAGSLDVGGIAQVVFDIPRTAGFDVLFSAVDSFEFIEQLFGQLADDIDQDVEPAAVGHADDRFAYAGFTARLHEFVQQRDQGFAPLQREAFLAHVFPVQVFFQGIGGNDPFQDAFPLFLREAVVAFGFFQPALDPAFLFRLVDVHVLGADRAAIRALDDVEDFSQRQLIGRKQGTRIENPHQVFLREIVVSGVQLRHFGPLVLFQGIQVGLLVPAETVGIDQLQYRGLLFVVRIDGIRTRGFRGAFDCRRRFCGLRVAGAMGLRGFPLQGFKILSPFNGHAGGVFKIPLIDVLDEGGIAAEKMRWFSIAHRCLKVPVDTLSVTVNRCRKYYKAFARICPISCSAAGRV